MSAGPVTQEAALTLIDHLPALQVVVPLLGSVAAALFRRGWFGYAIALGVSWAMPVISLMLLHQVMAGGAISYALGGFPPPIGIEYRIDEINAYLLVLVSFMAALIMTYAPRSIADEIRPEHQGWYYAIFLLCLCGLLGMIVSGDAFNIFVFMEVSSLATYVLIALGRDRRALVAAYQYLVIGTIGATFYVIGVGLILVMTGSLNLYDIASRLDQAEDLRPLLAGLGFVTVGLGLKIALFPMHLWLPNAYAFAPSVATAFLASTATKVAIYLLLRMLFSVYGVEITFAETPADTLFAVLAAAAMLVAGVAAIFQANVKRMLAYSSVAQVGYMILGIALVSETGLTGGLAHMLNHALIKGTLFLAIGCVVFSTGIVKIERMAGLGRVMPLTMGAFVLAGLALIGVPGTAGFISKWILIQGAAEDGRWLIVAVIVASSLLAVLYIGRVVEVAWFRAPVLEDTPRKPPLEMMIVTWLMVGLVLFFGFWTEFSVGVARDAAALLMEGYPR
ncbi:MAG TPA: monovalent cation/H+ antiporter subunit D family protein [Thermohalobaculum sp.]|nr:monovalent cation/H+ antiporter subunit D family protein [Thermohalobaculum sp.]